MEPDKRRASSTSAGRRKSKTGKESRIQRDPEEPRRKSAAGSSKELLPSGAPAHPLEPAHPEAPVPPEAPAPVEPPPLVAPAHPLEAAHPQVPVVQVPAHPEAPVPPVEPDPKPEDTKASSSLKAAPGRLRSISAPGNAAEKHLDATGKASALAAKPSAAFRMRNLPRHSTTSLVATSKGITRCSVSNGGHEATSPNEDKDKRKKSLQSLAANSAEVKGRAATADQDTTSSTTPFVAPIPRRLYTQGMVRRVLAATGWRAGAKTPSMMSPDSRCARSFVKQSTTIQRSHFVHSETRETWRPGTKKALVVIAALTLTTCLGIFLIRMMYWVKFVAVSNFCTTDACHAYSKNLLESINKSVDPCQSFTQFVCGGWEQKHLSSVRETHIFDILDNLRRTARAMEIPVRGQSEAQRAAKLFLSCDDVLNGRSDQLRAVKRALESAGIVWPEQPSKADALHTLLHSSLVLGWGTLLDFVIVRSAHQDTLVIKAGRALLLVIDHTRGFKTEAARVSYFTQLWGSFQRDHSGHGTVTVSYEDTVVIESLCMERLAKLYFTHERGSVLSQLEKVKDINGTRMTVNRWLTNLAILNITFSKGIHLTTTTSEYFGAVLDLWAELGEGRFHLLVSWCTVQVAALYANQELISNFYAHSPKMATTYHGIFCVSRTMYLSAHTLFSSYDADILQSDAGEDAQATILSVREAFRRRLMKWAYSDPNVTVVSNWSSLEAVFRNFAATNYTSPFGDFSDMTDSLADNWHKVTQLAGGATGTFAMPYLVYRLHYHVVLPDEQDFQLMPYALSFPLFHDELTAAINYGGLGAVVSRALGTLFIDAYETAGPALARRIEMVLNCVYGQAPTDEDTGVDTRAEAFGMSAVVDAYKNVDPPDQSVSGLEEYTGTQLFFIALCYHKCRGRAKRNLETVCDIPFTYFPEFAAAFRCDPRTSMHPLQRCGLF